MLPSRLHAVQKGDQSLIQLPKLCANKKTKGLWRPSCRTIPSAGLSRACYSCYSNSPGADPKELQWTAVSVPRNYSLSVTQHFGLEEPSGVTSSKLHSKQGLFRRDPAAQGRGGSVQGCRSHSLWTEGTCLHADLSRALLGSDLLSFVLPMLLNAPLLALHVRASMESQRGDRPHPAQYRCQIWNFCCPLPLFSSLP